MRREAEPELPTPLSATADGSVDALLGMVAEERERLSELLLRSGALLFRGFEVATLADFGRFVRAFAAGGELFSYAGGASPRNALGDGSYSSTEYPADMTLSLHNELSYADVYPRRLFFFCLQAAETGGETTLGDSRRILQAIDAEVVDRFKARGVRYARNLSPAKGSGYSWQDAFETDDPAVAEQGCRNIGAEFEWREGGILRMSQLRPATAVHPETGEEVWFNQADGFHPTALDAETYAAQMALCGSEDLFRLNVSYGDGSPIEAETLAHVRGVLNRHAIPHRWQPGDVVVLDNLLAAHGRMPFAGPRKIALAMA